MTTLTAFRDQPTWYIIGASGLAREMSQLARVVVPQWHGDLVLCDADQEASIPEGAPTVMAIGHAGIRGRVFTRLREKVTFLTLVHPRADVGDTTTVGEGTIITSGVVTTTDVTIGRGVLLNGNCTVGHDASVGDFCVLNPGVAISGGVTIGASVLVGTGACILEGLRVGDGATVGAGAVVTHDVGDGEVVVGAPARPLRRKDTR